jgi:4-amino-4-deoxy-L-arabinose transferase-like glycosyltransferase
MTALLSPAPRAAAPTPAPRLRWERWALAALLAGAAALYLWNLSVNGWANAYYAGAVKSMTRSWEAFFFGGADAGGIITVDKPPASLWVMAVSAELFGLSSWSLLVPQALMGVGTVALVHAAVRRVSGPGAALVAGVVMALTPVAVLMFRFDNPDALLVLLTAGAAYAVVRAVERAGTRWLLLAGVLIGFAFLTKTAQAFLVLPGLALAYLWAAPTGLARRIRQLLAAGLAVVVSGGWWFAVVDLWPKEDRPYIGGSTTNSALELALGYNGLGRLFGGGAGGGPLTVVPAGGELPGGSPFGGGAGIGRLFSSSVGGQVAWLLPAALVLLVAGLWLTRRAPRTDAVRASLLLWGGWTLVTAAVFSLMSGIFHEYYTVALAPGIAALVGIGGAELWRRREHTAARATLAAVAASTAAWAVVLLLRTPDLPPALPWATAALGLLAAVALLVGRRIAPAGLVAAVVAASLGPAAYAVDTASSARTGSIVLAGPATAGGPGGMVRPAGGDGGGGPDGGGAFGAAPGGPELTALLRAAGTTWSAATPSTASSAQLALDSGTDVIGIGGFSGSDPAPTLEQFQALVAAGEVRYYVPGGAGGGPGGGAVDPQQLLEQLPPAALEDPQLVEALESGQLPGGRGGSEIETWVEETFTAVTVGGTTVYDLADPA